MIRYVITAAVALTIGVLVGIGITELTAHRQVAAAESRIAELEESRGEVNGLIKWVVDGSEPLEYASVSGSSWDVDLEQKVFRLCQRVPLDLDAANLFIWARDQTIKFRKDERLLDNLPKPLIARKPFVTCMGEVAATGETMRFAVLPIKWQSGEDVLDATLRWAKEMELRRVESGD